MPSLHQPSSLPFEIDPQLPGPPRWRRMSIAINTVEVRTSGLFDCRAGIREVGMSSFPLPWFRKVYGRNPRYRLALDNWFILWKGPNTGAKIDQNSRRPAGGLPPCHWQNPPGVCDFIGPYQILVDPPVHCRYRIACYSDWLGGTWPLPSWKNPLKTAFGTLSSLLSDARSSQPSNISAPRHGATSLGGLRRAGAAANIGVGPLPVAEIL